MNTPTRRDVLLASVSIPVATALVDVPLSQEELRVLAMTATPKEAWKSHDEYIEARRIILHESDTFRIVRDLEVRGLLERTPTPWRSDMDFFVTPTQAGFTVLRKAGVLDA